LLDRPPAVPSPAALFGGPGSEAGPVPARRRWRDELLLNHLKAEETEEGENLRLGILLCSDQNDTPVEYALGGLSHRLFVALLRPHAPAREERAGFLRRTRQRLRRAARPRRECSQLAERVDCISRAARRRGVTCPGASGLGPSAPGHG